MQVRYQAAPRPDRFESFAPARMARAKARMIPDADEPRKAARAEWDQARGVAFCVEEVLTDRVWNLLFIGVAEGMQNTGIGGRLLRHVEDRLRQDSQRMLVIETTNGPEFEGARAFYESHQYTEEGTVRDFYAEGAHKIAFRKVLSPKASDTPQGG